MLTEQEAFIREIAADPESDVPRLIYADWLEERGDPQGEFIRVQCELAQLPVDGPEVDRLKSRVAELLAEHRTAWVADVSAAIRWNTFRRGFVEQVILDGSALATEGAQALRRAPIRELGIVLQTPEQVATLADSPEFRQLRKLRVGGSLLGDAGVERLMQSKYFPQLESFWATGCGIGPAGVAAMAACGALAGLERLVLSHNPIGDEGARRLARAEILSSLQILAVDGCGIENAGVEAIATSAHLSKLSRAPITDTWHLDRRFHRTRGRSPPAEPDRTDTLNLVFRPTGPSATVEEILSRARARSPAEQDSEGSCTEPESPGRPLTIHEVLAQARTRRPGTA